MVSKRAEQRDPAYDLSVRDHLVLSGISCRLQKQIGHRRGLPQSSSAFRFTAGASGFLNLKTSAAWTCGDDAAARSFGYGVIRNLMQTHTGLYFGWTQSRRRQHPVRGRRDPSLTRRLATSSSVCRLANAYS